MDIFLTTLHPVQLSVRDHGLLFWPRNAFVIRMSVCLSVCLSQSWVTPKWLLKVIEIYFTPSHTLTQLRNADVVTLYLWCECCWFRMARGIYPLNLNFLTTFRSSVAKYKCLLVVRMDGVWRLMQCAMRPPSGGPHARRSCQSRLWRSSLVVHSHTTQHNTTPLLRHSDKMRLINGNSCTVWPVSSELF